MEASPSGDNRGPTLIKVDITLLTLSTIAICLRIWSRLTSRTQGFWWDDWLAIATMVSSPVRPIAGYIPDIKHRSHSLSPPKHSHSNGFPSDTVAMLQISLPRIYLPDCATYSHKDRCVRSPSPCPNIQFSASMRAFSGQCPRHFASVFI